MSRSVSAPDFKYTPSHNIYWDKLMHLPKEMEGLAFTDGQTEIHRGSWRENFLATRGLELKSKPMLHVEIGCNAGHVCLEWAKQNKDELYIGIDWKFKQIYRLAEKSAKNEVKNLLAFRANADRLTFMFTPKEILSTCSFLTLGQRKRK
jgi:tRNA G46 methylase TrmB